MNRTKNIQIETALLETGPGRAGTVFLSHYSIVCLVDETRNRKWKVNCVLLAVGAMDGIIIKYVVGIIVTGIIIIQLYNHKSYQKYNTSILSLVFYILLSFLKNTIL
jgi:hypothetical protein